MPRLEKYAESCYLVYQGMNGLLGKIEMYGRGDWIASPARKMSAARHFVYRKEAIAWLVSFCNANT